ncbi:hypothetical protein CVT24_012449 [Panaeolus cyanescens]|uniref:Uncharacterized protein n=1 Tax=Panaeolus cyanescens TaxID=181874 RepID=A0A409YYQ2_9AGAR|nr:hypothetical protein CVT24_012449 [Panaeolus cyanescens]
MWNLAYGETTQKRAHSNYDQLQNEIWKVDAYVVKDFISQGSRIVKFDNTRESAISAMNESLREVKYGYFEIERTAIKVRPSPTQGSPIEDHVAFVKRENIEAQLETYLGDSDSDSELKAILETQLKETNEDLLRFQHQLEELGPLTKVSPPPALQPKAPPQNPVRLRRVERLHR